jgi:predicted RNA-binding protein Jag
MKRLFIISLVVMIGTTSCAIKEKEMAKESKPSEFQPKPLDDDWSKWLVGEWEGAAESDVGTGKIRMKIGFDINGQFLIMKNESEITEITDQHRQYLREILHASDEDIERSQSSTFKELQIHTIDPKTSEIIGYLFDSLRCIAKGIGRRQGNKEIMEWKWSPDRDKELQVFASQKKSATINLSLLKNILCRMAG